MTGPQLPTLRRRVRTGALVAIAVGLVAAGCTSEPGASGTTDAPGPFVPLTSLPPTTTTTSPPTTTTAPVDLLMSCVDHAKFQAFTGNEFWDGIWRDAGQTDEGMRAACEFLATGRPGWLEEIDANWQELQRLAGTPPETTAP